MRKRKFWGWGWEDVALPAEFFASIKGLLSMALGADFTHLIEPPDPNKLHLRQPRFVVPDALKELLTDDPMERAGHSYGQAFRDVWRKLHGDFDNPPDYVALPHNEEQISALMAFAAREEIALIPYGGGTSVTGGLEPRVGGRFNGVISLDTRHFNRVLEVDEVSKLARLQAGILGPDIQKALRPYNLCLRHYPQSFEFSTLGGWLATRAGGHYSTIYTHIDDLTASIRMVTPEGVLETRRLPGSGAGPDPNRMMLGSEGILGVITEAWMRVQDIPKNKASATVDFNDFADGVEACRRIAQAGLFPTNARLVSAPEALAMGLGNGMSSVLVLAFESLDHLRETWLGRALAICEELGGQAKIETQTKDEDRSETWKKSFTTAPYLRDVLVQHGIIVETFETAITWEAFPSFH